MARLKEALRRGVCGIPVRFWACCIMLTVLCAMLATVGMLTRFYTVTATGDAPAFIQAPAVRWGGDAYVLSLAGVQAAQDDVLSYVETGGGQATLHVERAFSLQVTEGGTVTTRSVIKGTVAEVLQSLDIVLGAEDFTEPALTEPVTRATNNLTVHRVSYRDYCIDEIIPFETQYQYTSLFYRNKTQQMVIQEGHNGYLKADLRDKLIDGTVVETVTVTTQAQKDAVPQILKVYQAGVPVSAVEAPPGITINENGEPSSYSTVYDMKATGYFSPRGRGASGLGLYYGTFAVDPTLIPYGTKVYIASENGKFIYGWAIATDTGGFIHTNRMQVDLFYETYAESAINAVHRVKVYVP